METKTDKQEGLARVSVAAEWLSMSRGAVYKGINSGTIPHVRIDGNVRIPWTWLHRQAAEDGARHAVVQS